MLLYQILPVNEHQTHFRCVFPYTPKNMDIWKEIRKEIILSQLEYLPDLLREKVVDLQPLDEVPNVLGSLFPDTNQHDTILNGDTFEVDEMIIAPIDRVIQIFAKFNDLENKKIKFKFDDGFIIGPCRYLVEDDESSQKIRVRTNGLSFWFYFQGTKVVFDPSKVTTDATGRDISFGFYIAGVEFMKRHKDDIMERAKDKPLNSSGVGESTNLDLIACIINDSQWDYASKIDIASPKNKIGFSGRISWNTDILFDGDCVFKAKRILASTNAQGGYVYDSSKSFKAGKTIKCDFLKTKIANAVKKGKFKVHEPR